MSGPCDPSDFCTAPSLPYDFAESLTRSAGDISSFVLSLQAYVTPCNQTFPSLITPTCNRALSRHRAGKLRSTTTMWVHPTLQEYAHVTRYTSGSYHCDDIAHISHNAAGSFHITRICTCHPQRCKCIPNCKRETMKRDCANRESNPGPQDQHHFPLLGTCTFSAGTREHLEAVSDHSQAKNVHLHPIEGRQRLPEDTCSQRTWWSHIIYWSTHPAPPKLLPKCINSAEASFCVKVQNLVHPRSPSPIFAYPSSPSVNMDKVVPGAGGM